MNLKDLPEISGLSAAEKILLLEDLWESIAADESSVPVPPSHLEELENRLASYQSDPGRLLTLDELQGRLEKRK